MASVMSRFINWWCPKPPPQWARDVPSAEPLEVARIVVENWRWRVPHLRADQLERIARKAAAAGARASLRGTSVVDAMQQSLEAQFAAKAPKRPFGEREVVSNLTEAR